MSIREVIKWQLMYLKTREEKLIKELKELHEKKKELQSKLREVQ